MKRNPFLQYLMLFCLLVLIFVGSGSNAHDVSDKAGPIPVEPASQTSEKRKPSLALTADALLHKLRQNQPITLVDIRPPEEFDQARIPGSINIPRHAVKTKTFLKSGPFVLVEDGYRYRSLERECEILWEAGFKAFFLIGGLNAWRHRGGRLLENVFEHRTFNRISPQAFYQEKDQEEWVVINVSAKQTPKSIELFPNALHIPLIGVTEIVALNIKKQVESGKTRHSYPLLVFNGEGHQYEKFDSYMNRAGFGNAFYLQGGLVAYEEFLNHLALSRKPREERLKTLGGCTKCGKEN